MRLPIVERIPLLRDQVYQILRGALERRDFHPGEPLSENALAEELGVSRTPVREALQRLEVEGFVVRSDDGSLLPGELTLEKITETHEIRALLEGYAVEKATHRINADQREHLKQIHATELELVPILEGLGESDMPMRVAELIASLNRQFHAGIVQACQSETLTRFLTLYDAYLLKAAFILAGPRETISFIHDHGQILQAIERGESSQASELMRRHLARAISIAQRQALATVPPLEGGDTQRRGSTLRA